MRDPQHERRLRQDDAPEEVNSIARTAGASAGAVSALLLVLAAVFIGIGDRDHIAPAPGRVEQSVKNLALAENMSADKLALFQDMQRQPDGRVIHTAYNRFPIGGMLLIKLTVAPFEGDLSAQILAGRVLMRVFFCAAALAAYLALCRLTGNRAVPFAATLLAFSSLHMLDMSDLITTEGVMDLFGVLLVFHGMVVFAQKGRFGQLAAKTCIALLLGWHAYALLAPFLVFGLASELVEAGRQARVSQRVDRAKTRWRGLRLLRTLAAQTARSRHTRLGLIALLAGVAVLGYNFGVEYALFGSERPFAELPSVRSALNRTGVGVQHTRTRAQWAFFLPWQFHRVSMALLPYGLSSPGEPALNEKTRREARAPPLAGVGVVATAACFGALLFAPAFRGRRPLWAVLALCGFCWALPMRHQTAWPSHDYETIYFVGVPLILFTVLLLGARDLAASVLAGRLGADRMRWRERVAIGGAVLGAAVFVASIVRMGAAGRDADESARWRTVMAEFERIRAVTRGRDVLVMRHYDKDPVLDKGAFAYYMAGSVLLLPRSSPEAYRLEAGGQADYVLGLRRACSTNPADWRQPRDGGKDPCEPTGGAADVHALTPTHRFVFLYAPGGAVQAIIDGWRRDYEAAVAAGAEPLADGARWRAAFRVDIGALRRAHAHARTLAPAARGMFNVHLHAGTLIYTREPCSEADIRARFFLHVAAPAEELPEHRRAMGSDNLDFDFRDEGAIFDGKCVAQVPLPDYAVNVTTGQFTPERGNIWSARIDMADRPASAWK